MSDNIALAIELNAQRRRDREALHDAISASIRRRREAAASVAPPLAPEPVRPAPVEAAPPLPTALDLEFERVRAAAIARHDAEQAAKVEEDSTVAAILQAGAMARGERPSGEV